MVATSRIRATLAARGPPLAVAIALVLHALRPDVHPVRQYVSEYANGPWGWLLTLALVLTAAGTLALASRLREVTDARVGPALLALLACSMVVAAAFSTDRVDGEPLGTLPGRVHGYAAVGGFALLVVAMVTLVGPFERHERLRPFSRVSLPLAGAAVLIVTTTKLGAPDADGLGQRLFLALVFGWLAAIGRFLPAADSPAEPAPARLGGTLGGERGVPTPKAAPAHFPTSFQCDLGGTAMGRPGRPTWQRPACEPPAATAETTGHMGVAPGSQCTPSPMQR